MSADRPLGLSTWAIRNPVPVAVLFIALTLAGLISYGNLPVKLFPNVQFPAVSVTVTQSGAAPGEMETQITRPVEEADVSLLIELGSPDGSLLFTYPTLAWSSHERIDPVPARRRHRHPHP